MTELMKTPGELEDLIMCFIASHFSTAAREELTPDTNLIADGYLDSVGMMRLIRHLESSLCIKIPPRDLIPRNFLSIGAMVAYLCSSLASPARPPAP